MTFAQYSSINFSIFLRKKKLLLKHDSGKWRCWQCSFDINSCRRRLSPSYFKNKYFSIELKLCEILWMCRWNGELYVFTIHFLLAIIQILHTIISFLFKFTILSNFSIYFLRSILNSSCSTSFFHSRVYFSFAKPQKMQFLMLLSPNKTTKKNRVSCEWVKKDRDWQLNLTQFFINRLTSLLLCTSVNIIFSRRISLSYIYT